MADRETSDADRELDRELDSLSGFWSLGLRSYDYVDWADGGMNAVHEARVSGSGVAGLEGQELANALGALETNALGWALGLSEKVEELDPNIELEAGAYRREVTGSNMRSWSRLVFDAEREVFAALAADGVQAARLRVEWAGPANPVSVIRPTTWAPWDLWRIHRAIDDEALGRRRTYTACTRCRRPTAPEHRSTESTGEVCHDCLESAGTVF